MGGAFTDDDKKMTFLKTLPRDLSQDLILRLGSFGSYNDVKEHAKQRSELMTFVSGKSSVHHIDIQQASSDEGAAFVDSKVSGNRIRSNKSGKGGSASTYGHRTSKGTGGEA